MLQLNEEEDDATSKLAELPPAANPKSEPLEVLRSDVGGRAPAFLDEYYVSQELPEHGCLGAEQYKSSLSSGVQQAALNYLDGNTNSDYQQFSLHQELHHNVFVSFDASRQNGGAVVPLISEFIPAICPPPSAFLMPKCALWDCPRPAQGSEWYQDYCSSFHATLALHEGPPGMTPVLRPGGIDLKDGPLFAALTAKTQGKNVGIPECEGAATAKSPWNAPELFDLLVLNGESLREWLFFDKPRRAFESGNRKQRSLPDYNGRGWHESRKQVMKEFGGLKRLELKLVDPNKSAKGKVMTDSLVDLQQQMGRLNAENPSDNKQYTKGRMKVKQKGADENAYLASNMVNQREHSQKLYSTLDQKAPMDENISCGPSIPYAYSVDNLKSYFGT